eukprot:3578989-Heterocapsa_arctica.AAC.1
MDGRLFRRLGEPSILAGMGPSMRQGMPEIMVQNHIGVDFQGCAGKQAKQLYNDYEYSSCQMRSCFPVSRLA